MQPGVGPEKPIQTQFSGQPQYINQQIQQSQGAFPQQQVIIINAKYKPDFNFRYLSYAVFALGMTASVIFSNLHTDSDVDQYLQFLGEASCCLSIILTFAFDAVFYKGKAEWQSTTGQSDTGSMIGMIFNILFAIIVIIFGYFWFIGD